MLRYWKIHSERNKLLAKISKLDAELEHYCLDCKHKLSRLGGGICTNPKCEFGLRK